MSEDDPQIIDKIGFRMEDDEDEDPIVEGDDTFFLFGRMNATYIFPELVTEEIALYKGSSYDPYKLIAAGTHVEILLGFQVIHAIILFMVAGRKESASGLEDGGITPLGGDTYLLTPITAGDLQSWVVRWLTSNGTNIIQKSVTGCKWTSLTFTLDLLSPRAPLIASLTGKGKYMQPVVVNTEAALPIAPSSLDTLWYPTDDMVCEFNGVDLRDYLQFISITHDVLGYLDGDKENHQPTENITGDRVTMLTMRLRRTDETSMFEAYMAQAGAKGVSANILNDFLFSLENKNTKVIAWLFTDCLIKRCKLNSANLKKGERPFYEIIMRATSYIGALDDGVLDPLLYGVGT